MADVKVIIAGKDRKVGAMVKALAVEVAGFKAVSGASMDFLRLNGFYVFHFPTNQHAADFRSAVSKYLSPDLANFPATQ